MVLKHPFVTEKAMMALERQNKVQFLVDHDATKDQIRRAIESQFGQQVKRITTMMTMHGEKKAIISFTNEKAAEEILSRLGIM
jgi:large subunit ribosomal protein L23